MSEHRAKELDAPADGTGRDVDARMAAAEQLQQQVADLMQINEDMCEYVRHLERELQTRTAELATRDDNFNPLRGRVEQGEQGIAQRVETIEADAATIAELEQQLANAWVKGDRAFIEDLLAPEWTVTDPSARVLTRDEVLAEAFASGTRHIETMTIDDVQVRVFGELAIATGRTRATGSDRGGTASVELRFTDVFVHRTGAWRVVASHGTLVTS